MRVWVISVALYIAAVIACAVWLELTTPNDDDPDEWDSFI